MEQFSQYRGYGSTFEWSGSVSDDTVRDRWGRRQTQVVAIDALVFNSSASQFKPGALTLLNLLQKGIQCCGMNLVVPNIISFLQICFSVMSHAYYYDLAYYWGWESVVILISIITMALLIN